MHSARNQPAPSARGPGNGSARSATASVFPTSARDEPLPTPRLLHDQYGLVAEASDPLQLDHVLGYSGGYRRTVHTLPIDEETFIKSLGSLISIESINDPQSQRFLRGHDMPVTCLAVSPSGNLIASGQEGTMNYKGLAAPIFVWDSRTGQRICPLRGLTVRCNTLAFSPDEQFLCGCDEDGLLYIWDLSTGEVVFGQKQVNPVTIILWADARKVSHNTAYELAIGIQSSLYQGLFTYDNMRMQWSMKLTAYSVPPSGGLIRTFLTGALSEDRLFVYLGTASGEMMVFRRDTAVFRACIPVCTNGLQDLIVLADGCVVCGGGDASVVKLKGRDLAWQKIREVKMDSAVRALSAATNQLEVLVSCASGAIFRMMCADFSSSAVTHSNTATVNSISCSQTNSAYFATGSAGGEVRVWDLADYDCVSVYRQAKAGSVLCVQLLDNNQVLSGWQDGSVRCTSFNGEQVWFIPTAHREGTTTLCAYTGPPSIPSSSSASSSSSSSSSSLQFFVTGGMDGAIRVWKLSNRELITQYTEHRKPVARVLIDNQAPNIVHSVGGDCSVLTYDLKANKRIVCHIMNSGVMTYMTQRNHREYELITSDSLGRLLYWDVDYRDAVLLVQDPSHAKIRVCAVSPTGRFVAFAGDDQVLKVLDEVTHRVIALGHSHCAEITSLAWTLDEKQIVTGGADTCLSIWNFFLGGEAGHK